MSSAPPPCIFIPAKIGLSGRLRWGGINYFRYICPPFPYCLDLYSLQDRNCSPRGLTLGIAIVPDSLPRGFFSHYYYCDDSRWGSRTRRVLLSYWGYQNLSDRLNPSERKTECLTLADTQFNCVFLPLYVATEALLCKGRHYCSNLYKWTKGQALLDAFFFWNCPHFAPLFTLHTKTIFCCIQSLLVHSSSCNLMLNCVRASCLEEMSSTTETHAKQNPWLALWCGHNAFARLHSVGPVPAFYKCPIWQELCPAVSLKVLVQIPSSNVILIQVLNDPNDAFQIVSSHITFRGKRGLCFISYSWQPMGLWGGGRVGEAKKKKKESHVCTLDFFSNAYYGTFCWLIWASCSLGGKKKNTQCHQR